MDYLQFLQQTDAQRILLVEIQPAHEIESLPWTQHDTYTNLYFTSYIHGVVDKVEENGNVYLETYSLSEADATAGSFYYDFDNQILYLHTLNSDSPNTQTSPPEYDYIILAYFWRYFTSAQPNASPITFPRRQKRLQNESFEVWLSSGELKGWEKIETATSTLTKESDSPYEGAFCVKATIDALNSQAGIRQTFRLPPGKFCDLVVHYKTTGEATAKIEVRDSNSNVYLKSDGTWSAVASFISLPSSVDWAEYTLHFLSHTDYVDYIITLTNDSAASEACYFDLLQITAVREENYYLPYLTTTGVASLRQAVAPFYDTAMVMEFGQLQFANDGWWWEQVQTYLWNLKRIVVKYGKDSENTFSVIFYGQIRTPQVSDIVATIEVVDNKIYTYKSIPDAFFNIDTYPFLEKGADGKPIPIIYGEFGTDNDDPLDGIVPTKVSSTEYILASHEIEAITAVYRNGVLQTEGSDYTVDLSNAKVTFVSDPGESFVTCKVKGKKCSLIDGTYSQNVVDFLYDLLVSYCNIDAEELAIDSFLRLRAARTQFHHLYIPTVMSVIDIIRIFQTSALFYLIFRPDTKLAVVFFRSDDVASMSIQNEDTEQFSYEKEIDGVFSAIKLNYGFMPADGVHHTLVQKNPSVDLKYKEIQTLELTTSLRRKEDAADLLNYYSGVTIDPWIKVSVKIPSRLFNLSPGSKITISKKRTIRPGFEYDVLVDAPFRILQLEKDLGTSKIAIVGWDDQQAVGEGICEVCYACQLCYTIQTGDCSSCYSCQACYMAQCGTCQVCYSCQACYSEQCSVCESCDSCQSCVSCEATECGACVSCEDCYTVQCQTCQICNKCTVCYETQ